MRKLTLHENRKIEKSWHRQRINSLSVTLVLLINDGFVSLMAKLKGMICRAGEEIVGCRTVMTHF